MLSVYEINDIHMKLKVTQEGGFAALMVQKQIDTKKLPPKLQSSMNSFIKRHSGEKGKTNPLLRDGYLYTVEWSGEKEGKIQFDESNIPHEIEAVVQFMLK